MFGKATFAASLALLALSVSSDASSQEAAETAQILAGVGQGQAGSSRSLGSSVSRSLNGARAAIRSGTKSGGRPGGRQPDNARTQEHIPANVDSLSHTDAPTYRLESGATIKVSRGLLRSVGTTCVKDCPVDPANK